MGFFNATQQTELNLCFGGSPSVYIANWKNTSTMYAIKKSVNNKEVWLLKDEKKYLLILEYADGGTLGKYLRNNTIEWKNQLRFAKEIASAICWLHDTKKIVHGDFHPNNILVHKDAVKLADFGRSSCLKGSGYYNIQVWGVVPYVDPKMLNQKILHKINEKSDIYSLGVIFWELTSRSSPFDGLEGDHITYKILSGVREEPVLNTNVKFIRLYQKCWEQELDERPNIFEINETLSIIDFKNDNVPTVPYSKGRK
ncbi:kinase-like domain-containing protein [Rhizophagus irregularis DAOM 181602=DAOM 197198]|uniref:Kinase-like domain-containing protein n=2 Tax=Rhizophagus irregularis (strain DAOM 181602 / DAOM 197198 / MUCL 43194) TaxID=747089 RepID=A0A2P4NZ69_RHIID|nr:kinase-like domain-containing protein [Rhizophagus irregularis DAOM 181602=DAOM 197198]POG58429.1 kinase-like domain-containing protein [Rhizophagus irregularis DAOM 181602=DAOM 197198]|eukprot:XP_025165295.1 kinase-like domain-containing protein [Rhizophagus irregularis DAOM 181602=DAOM 197198]